jgi:8-oxo-dGTP diphosphatase
MGPEKVAADQITGDVLATDMRDLIRELVGSIDPWDDIEREHRTDALGWIDSGAPLFRRAKPATPPKHLVSYFVVVDRAHQRLLLVDHILAGLWLPSGGHVEPDEDPTDTVRREVVEELQVDARFLMAVPLFITVTDTVGSTAGHTDVSLWYVLHGDCTKELIYDREELHSIAWFPLEDLPLERTDPHLVRFAGKLRSYLANHQTL